MCRQLGNETLCTPLPGQSEFQGPRPLASEWNTLTGSEKQNRNKQIAEMFNLHTHTQTHTQKSRNFPLPADGQDILGARYSGNALTCQVNREWEQGFKTERRNAASYKDHSNLQDGVCKVSSSCQPLKDIFLVLFCFPSLPDLTLSLPPCLWSCLINPQSPRYLRSSRELQEPSLLWLW